MSGEDGGVREAPDDYTIQQAEADLDHLRRAATEVMKTLHEWGPGIVPHLMDTDENDGERLRELIGYHPTTEPMWPAAWIAKSQIIARFRTMRDLDTGLIRISIPDLEYIEERLKVVDGWENREVK